MHFDARYHTDLSGKNKSALSIAKRPTCLLTWYDDRLIQSVPFNLYVGPDKVLFRIPKDLLCSRSPYFEAALYGGFKESAEDCIFLLEDDPDIFTLFAHYIYTGNVGAACSCTKNSWDPPPPKVLLSLRQEIELCIMAERYLVLALVDLCVERLNHAFPGAWDFAELESLLPPSVVFYVFEKTGDQDRLRKAIAEITGKLILHNRDYSKLWERCFTEIPEFAIAVIQAMSSVPEHQRDNYQASERYRRELMMAPGYETAEDTDLAWRCQVM